MLLRCLHYVALDWDAAKVAFFLIFLLSFSPIVLAWRLVYFCIFRDCFTRPALTVALHSIDPIAIIESSEINLGNNVVECLALRFSNL